MSALDEIKKLDEKKQQLVSAAKEEALAKAREAIADLNALGFSYTLTDTHKQTTTRSPRRSGIRSDLLAFIQGHPEGVTRAQVIELLDAKGDKSMEQSVSNALSALKKQEQVTLENGLYRPA